MLFRFLVAEQTETKDEEGHLYGGPLEVCAGGNEGDVANLPEEEDALQL